MVDIAVHTRAHGGVTRGAVVVLVGVAGILLGIGAETLLSAVTTPGLGPASGPGILLLGLVTRSGSDRASDIERLTDELEQFVSRLDRGEPASFAADAGGDRADRDGVDDGEGLTDLDEPVDFTIDRDDEIGRLSAVVDELTATIRDRERRRAESERYRKELYRITADTDLESDAKIRRLLELGCERLGLETGLITQIDEDDGGYELETVVEHEFASDVAELDLPRTFCQETIESDGILGIYDAAAEGWDEHPAAEDVGISCYVGGKILVEGDLYGTLCFLNSDPRDRPFTPAEKSFVDLMTRWVSQMFERREHVRTIRERQRRLERYKAFTDNVLNSLDDVFYVLDEDMVLQRANETFREVTGYTVDEIREEGIVPFSEAEFERVRAGLRDVLEEGSARMETEFLTASGDTVPYELVATAFDDPDGNRVVAGVGRDISERKARERKLERTRRMLTQAQRSANVGAWELDATCDPPELEWTDEVYRIHGVPIGEAVDTDRALELYHPDDRHRIEDAVDAALEDGERYDLELRVVTPDGDCRWVRTIGEPVVDGDEVGRIWGSIQDITERKERERELERTSELLGQTQRIAGVGGWELDLSGEPPYDGTWTDQMYEIFERERERADDRKARLTLSEGTQYIHPDDRERMQELFERALETGEGFTTEHRILTEDGAERWVRATAEPSVDGETVHGAVFDITDSKERERELERTTGLLEQAQQMARVAGWELDVRSEEYELTVTEGLYRLFSVSPETDIGPADAVQFYHPDDRERALSAVETAIEDDEMYDHEARMYTADGSERWMRIIGEPISEGDEVVAIRGSIQDITERKERERELERFETIIQALDELVYTLDSAGRFQFVNDAVTPILGYEPDALIGEPAATVIPSDGVERAQEMIRELLRSDEPSRTVEIGLETVDGDVIDVENHIALLPMTDGEFVGTAGVVRDITERKERERRLETTSARLEALFENSPDMVDVLDTAGTVIDANRRIADELGYAESELIGTNIWEYDIRFDADEVQALLEELSVGERRKFEGLYRRRDGSTFPVEVHLICIELENENRFIAISRDITERKERERDLRETKRRLELALEGTNTGVWEWNLETDTVDWNETLERLVGLEPGSFGGTFEDFKRRVHPDDVPQIEAAADRVIESGGLFQTEYRLRREDGTLIWVGSRGRLVSDEEGGRRLVGINNDITQRKDRELALESLHDAARDLLGTDTEREVAELVTETAADILDASGVAIYRLDPAASRFEPTAHTDAFASLCRGPPSVAVGDSDSVVWNAYVTGTGTVVDDPASFDRSQVFGPAVESGVVVPVGDHGVFVVASDTETIDAEARRLMETLVATTEAAFDRLESEASLREREAELEDRNRRLNRQIEITELIRRIDQSLIGADSREEIERTVAERLLEADTVSFAWIGTHDPSGTRLEPRAWAGSAQEYLDTVSLEYDGSTEPALRTARSEAPTVVSNAVEELQDEVWRRQAVDRGFQSVISVPLSHAEYTYGVLTVYADEPDAFGDLERTVLTELGAGIANAITAVKTREALHAERLLELTLRIEGADNLLSRIATATGAGVEYEGLGTHSADETLLFFETSGVPAEDVRAALDDLVSVAAYRLISERDGDCRFEATVAGDVVASRLVRHGGSPRSMRADGDELELVVDVPTGTDVREFVELLRDRYPTVELQARRHVERTMGTRSELVTSLFDALTDRQLEVLRTAYFAGFFEWPRESTGEEIADMLEVTQPTVNRHLRVGQQRLLAQLFEDEVPVPAE
ncbi:PAS domain S-box protein [Natrinema salaciae]|uniref:histidine kinase n=1 Tax=Natrinema salaciae TaxID=1186196 RepID=A0A1H9IDQ3_9EURY|nr:PAS domain S-box protein [Natrinema salaciae]SEQ72687.1 PAS domain S-box-containing protein [Natrinema salaciae]